MKNNKEYDNLIYNMIKSKNFKNNVINTYNYEKKQEFKDYFLNVVKKSSFLGQILPLILFLIISLVSFSLIILNEINPNFTFIQNDNNLIISILLFGTFFFIIAIILLIQNLILKTKTIKLNCNYRKGYHNISRKKYCEIMSIINY